MNFCGTVYSLTPPPPAGGVWTESVLHAFSDAHADGAAPSAAVTVSAGGIVYGATVDGGTHKAGTVFQVKP